MNRLEALRPITRRALRIFYASPDICAAVEEASGTGTSCSVESNLDIEAVTRAAGPVLSLSDNGGEFELTWTAVPEGVSYFLYRATAEEGPYTLINTTAGLSYTDSGLDAGEYFYYVVALEPNYGLTEHSNVVAGTIGITSPPVPGYLIWTAPESVIAALPDGTGAVGTLDDIQYWEDLSGNNNHLTRNLAVHSARAPQLSALTQNGLRLVEFGTGDIANARTALCSPSVPLTTAGWTVFFVGALLDRGLVESGEEYGNFFSYSGAFGCRRQGNTNAISIYDDIAGSGGPFELSPSPAGTFFVGAMRFDNAANNARFFKNGVSTLSLTTFWGGAASANVVVGARIDDLLFAHLGGYIGEFIAYPGALTDGQVALVTAYLQSKFGI